MKSKLKLFVWHDYCTDYTAGLAVAIAKDVAEAKELIINDMGFDADDWGDLTIYPVNKKMATSVCGGG